ncbi:hypothetical protein BC831DRAFT_447487 [Entophlyctis helioformis]|nr:hypothetical protein BC831DRAFT_447487 [Entophlyctis helioformis]
MFAMTLTPIVLATWLGCVASSPVQLQRQGVQGMQTKVPVTLFVMSKCPDAVLCERVFASVLEAVAPITDLTTQYIGKAEPDGFVCRHGESECVGNIQQLCARDLFPEANRWFSFVQCQNENDHWRSIPAGSHECFKRAISPNQTDLDRWQACVDGEYGSRLLRESLARTQAAGVTNSCTIAINGEKRCVHDSDWKQCPGGHEVDDFVRDICAAAGYPEICSSQLAGDLALLHFQ